MRSWIAIYTLLARACLSCFLFGPENITVIRVMVDCLAMCIVHDEGIVVTLVTAVLADGALGDGVTPGSWKDEFEGKVVDEWYQLNKYGYETHYTEPDGSGRM